MEKAKLDRAISLLKEKIEELAVYNRRLYSENVRLRKQLDSLSVQSAEQQDELDSLRRKVESVALTDAFIVSMGSKKEARNTIKTILREVDDCIALINK